eukprot:15439428-Alexandrium_andersonii.AAC.1
MVWRSLGGLCDGGAFYQLFVRSRSFAPRPIPIYLIPIIGSTELDVSSMCTERLRVCACPPPGATLVVAIGFSVQD